MNTNTAGKSVIRWKAVPHENPSNRAETIYIPTITERNDTKTLTDVVYSAIDRGLIAGLKTSAAQAIAEGILAQLGQELNSAHGVIFGDFFAVRAYLDGTVDGYLGSLTADNKLNTRFVAGSALKLDRRNFSFRNVLETGDAPVIDSIQAARSGAVSGEIVGGIGIQIVGSNLKVDADDRFKCWKVTAEGEEDAGVWTAQTLDQNSDVICVIGGAYTDAFTPGSRYAFALVKTVEVEDGRTATVESNKVYVTCVAA